MTPQAVERAKLMLVDLVESKASYADVGRKYGVGRSSAQRSVRGLVELVATAGELPVQDPAFMESIAGIRAHGKAVLDGLARLSVEPERGGTRIITPRDLQEAAATLRTRSENGNRDVALLYLLFSTGAKPLEIAQLRVRDYLMPDGSTRRVSVRPASAFGRKVPKPIYFNAPRLQEAVDAYLRERGLRGFGAGRKSRYRGLDPDSPLFLTGTGQAFEMRKRSAGDKYLFCPGLIAVFRAIFKKARLPGVTTRSARRQVARSLAASGASEDQLREVLGVGSARSIRNLTRPVARPTESLMQDLV